MISDEAVEAAVIALMINSGGALADVARKALEAAAPYIAAEAWEKGKQSGFRDAYTDEEEEEPNPYRSQA